MANKIFAVILAAGSATRYRQGAAAPSPSSPAARPKQFESLGGRSVLSHSVAAFASCPEVDGLVVVLPPEMAAGKELEQLLPADVYRRYHSKLIPVAGGADRAASTNNGLAALAAEDKESLVLVHDAARPLLPAQIIRQTLAALEHHEAVAVAMPMSDTLGYAEDLLLRATLPRAGHFNMQTPQGFRLGLLHEAHLKGAGSDYTDDCSVVLAYRPSTKIHLIMGGRINMKITYPEDLLILEMLLKT